MKCTHMSHAINDVNSYENFVATKNSFETFATKRIYKVRWSTLCVSKKVIYIAFSLSCLKQGAISTVDWKPRLRNYETHIKKKVQSCSIVSHFIDVCSDTDDPSENITFIIIDHLNNNNSLSPNGNENLLL